MNVYIVIGHIDYEADEVLRVCRYEEDAIEFIEYWEVNSYDSITYDEWEVN